MQKNLFAVVEMCLVETNPAHKVALTEQAARAWRDGQLECSSLSAPLLIGAPGRPEQPVLVIPREVPTRSLGTPLGQVGLTQIFH